MHQLHAHKLPRIRSFNDADDFFQAGRYKRKNDPSRVFLTRMGDDSKTMIRTEHEGSVTYGIKYHQTVMIQYTRSAERDGLYLNSGRNSKSDRAILNAMTPFNYESFQGYIVFVVNGLQYVCGNIDLILTDGRWVVDKIHKPTPLYQLTVTGRLSKKRADLLDHINSWHKLTKRDEDKTSRHIHTSGNLLALAQTLCAAPEQWAEVARATHPRQASRLKRLLTIAEGHVTKRKLPVGELPTSCVYDHLADHVPLTD